LHVDLGLLGYTIPEQEQLGGVFGDGTRSAVSAFRDKHGLSDTAEVDGAVARAITAAADEVRPRVVNGRVADVQRRPVAEVPVVALDLELRAEAELGRTTTDLEGAYQITYTLEQLGRADKRAPDLVVRALTADYGRVLVESPVIHGAEPVVTVDVELPIPEDAPSELERYLAELEPALGGVSPAQLSADDLDFLAGATGIAREHLAVLAAADRRQAEDEADPVNAGEPSVRAPAYYGWFRQGLPTEPVALWARSDEELTSALTASIRARLIPSAVGDLIPSLPEIAGRRRLNERLRPAPDDQPAGLGDLLDTLPHPLERSRQIAVARVLDELPADTPDLVEMLETAGLSRAQAIGVQRTLRLGDLTLGHAPLVQALQEHVAADDDASLRSLANLPTDRWIDLAYAHGAPVGSDLDAPSYAASLESKIEALHPAETLAARLSAGRLALTRPEFAELSTFLADNPAVDLLGASVDTIAADARFENIRDRDQLVEGLRQVQRVKALGATWTEATGLLNAGITSALDIVQAGPGRLEEAAATSIEADRLDAVHAAAMASHDLTLTTMVATLPRFQPLTPTIGILEGSKANTPDPAELPPNLRTLFGDLDDCDCRHCASVLSPAAYLVDLLEFVKPNTAAFARLAERRPDLLDLALSCENTETELPHIDLALEILENAVVLPLDVDLAAGTDGTSLLGNAARDTQTHGSVPIPEMLTAALSSTTARLPDRVSVTGVDRPPYVGGRSRWTVADPARRWSLSWQESGFFAAAPGGPPADRLPFPESAAAAAISGLDAGTVPSALQARFESFLQSRPPFESVLQVGTYEILPMEPGRLWRIRYPLSVDVQIVNPGLLGGTLTLTDPQGGIVRSGTYSGDSLTATAEALDRGYIGGILLAWIGPRPAPYEISKLDASHWTVAWTNELELHRRMQRLTVDGLCYQSAGPDDGLLSAPENRNPAAYELLRTAEFPWSLPFDLPLLELRAFLDRLGLHRRQLLELLEAPGTGWQDDTLAHEVLGLSEHEADLIATPAAPDAPNHRGALWYRWGLKVQRTADPEGHVAIRDLSTDTIISGEPLEVLGRVSIVLQQSRLDLAGLRDVLDTRFVQSASATPLAIRPADECTPSKLKLTGITANHLDRIHRFVRLRRALGWQVPELDQAISSVAAQAQDGAELLRRLSHLQLLHEAVHPPIEVIASWWGDLSTRAYPAHARAGQPPVPALYDRVYLNPLLDTTTVEAFRLNSDRTELAAPGTTITDKATQVCAALGIGQEDLAALIPSDPATVATVPDVLNLRNLSTLHAVTTLSKAFGLPVAGYPTARRLIGIDPLLSTDRALDFRAAVDAVRSARLTLADLACILYDETADTDVALDDDQAAAILARLRTELQDAQTATTVGRGPLTERLQTLLTRGGWAPERVEAFLRHVGGRTTAPLPDDPRLLAAVIVPEQLRTAVRISGRIMETIDVLPETALDPNSLDSLYEAVDSTTAGYADYV
jgi:hypothetical protein